MGNLADDLPPPPPAEAQYSELAGRLIAIIDTDLAAVSGRSLVDAGEVSDMLLDIRRIVAGPS